MEHSELSRAIIGAAMRVHHCAWTRADGIRLHDLYKAGLRSESQKALPVVYDDISLDTGYRIDLLVEGIVVVELKAVEELLDIHKAQLISYLKLGNFPVGLLINFNVVHLRNGIRRFVNRKKASAATVSSL